MLTQGLTAASFTEGVEYRETGGTPPIKRTVTSRNLDTALNGSLGDIREATFAGSVRLRDENGGTAANAEQMRYHVTTGQVELTGTSPAGIPHVVLFNIATGQTQPVDTTPDERPAYPSMRPARFPAPAGSR